MLTAELSQENWPCRKAYSTATTTRKIPTNVPLQILKANNRLIVDYIYNPNTLGKRENYVQAYNFIIILTGRKNGPAVAAQARLLTFAERFRFVKNCIPND